MADGATELDMVINIGQALGGEWDAVTADIAAVTEGGARRRRDREGDLRELLPERRPEGPALPDLRRGRADYVKTSTGYGTGGATFEDLRLMRRSSPPHVKLKAAGGVRTLDAMIHVRRDRLRPHRGVADRRDPRRAQGDGSGS